MREEKNVCYSHTHTQQMRDQCFLMIVVLQQCAEIDGRSSTLMSSKQNTQAVFWV